MSDETHFRQAIHSWSEVFMHRSMKDFKRFMNSAGLSFSQVNTLMRLHHSGACGVSDIGDHLGITSAASSQMVERLVGQGLLERSEDPQDRRGKQITLTDKGRALIRQSVEARSRWLEELTASLTLEEQEQITRALILLTEAACRLEIQTAAKGDQ